MSQLGGWSILDYGLNFATDPADYLRLGYASSLSSWALVNSGTEESGYGYWFPGKNNDGATGGGFMPEPSGRAWIGKTDDARRLVLQRGGRRRLRRRAADARDDPHARSDLRRDSRTAASLTRADRAVSVMPRDGLRVRFHVDPRQTSGCTWSSITTAMRRSGRSSSPTICRACSSRSRTARAARTRPADDRRAAGWRVHRLPLTAEA